jgi:hypothetical protein
MRIISNGSKWAGEEPDSLETLLEVLRTETLDPRFEERGSFVTRTRTGTVRIFGNFLTVSHVFNIEGTEEEMAEAINAIEANKRNERYLRALIGRASPIDR